MADQDRVVGDGRPIVVELGTSPPLTFPAQDGHPDIRGPPQVHPNRQPVTPGPRSAARASQPSSEDRPSEGNTKNPSDIITISDALPYLANRLGEMVACFDETNTHLKAFRGTFLEVQDGVGQVLKRQETEKNRLHEREQALDARAAENGRLFNQDGRVDDVASRQVRAVEATNKLLWNAQERRVQQALDIHRAVNTFEALFGDLAKVAQWVGKLVRRAFSSEFPILMAIVLTGCLVVIKYREMQQSITTDVTAEAGLETTSRIKMILESNAGWKELLKDPRHVMENLEKV